MLEQIQENIQSIIPDFNINLLTPCESATNKVFKVQSDDMKLIYRQFGDVPFIGRELEQQNYEKVFQKGLGPQILGTGVGFRLEEMLPGQTLQRQELGLVAFKAGQKLAQYHQIEQYQNQQSFLEITAQTWSQLFSSKKEQYKDNLSEPRKQILDEVSFLTSQDGLKEFREKLPKTNTLHFCHNDISYLNILKHEGELTIIDYELSYPNFISSDIAYYFTEAVFDYTAIAPCFRLCLEDELTQNQKQEFVQGYCDINTQYNPDDLLNQAEEIRPSVNFMGALWAACAYSNDDDPFDTLLYAQTRLGEYFRLRQ